MKESKNILCIGATGFLGEGVVKQLLNDNYYPIILTRNATALKNKYNNEVAENKLSFIESNIQNLSVDDIKKLNINIDACVYLIGIIKEKGNVTFKDAHFNWFRKTLEICEQIECKRVIYLSANGVKENGTGYQKTKWQAEQIGFENQNINFTSLRPSIITGESDKYNFINVLDNLTKFIFVPIFGSGKYKLAPVNRKDVSKIISMSLFNPKTFNNSYCIAGLNEYEYRELVKVVAKKKNRKVFLIHIPLWIIKPMVKILQFIPFFPISYDQLVMLLEGNTCKENKIWDILQLEKTKQIF